MNCVMQMSSRKKIRNTDFSLKILYYVVCLIYLFYYMLLANIFTFYHILIAMLVMTRKKDPM